MPTSSKKQQAAAKAAKQSKQQSHRQQYAQTISRASNLTGSSQQHLQLLRSAVAAQQQQYQQQLHYNNYTSFNHRTAKHLPHNNIMTHNPWLLPPHLQLQPSLAAQQLLQSTHNHQYQSATMTPHQAAAAAATLFPQYLQSFPVDICQHSANNTQHLPIKQHEEHFLHNNKLSSLAVSRHQQQEKHQQYAANKPLCRCRVMYLGSSVPHITKNGLHGIQEPLKHLYPEEQFNNNNNNPQKPNKTHVNSEGDQEETIDISHLSSSLGIDSWLSVWSNGLLLENVDEFGQQIKRFFSIESLHYCAAVRFFDTQKLSSLRRHDNNNNNNNNTFNEKHQEQEDAINPMSQDENNFVLKQQQNGVIKMSTSDSANDQNNNTLPDLNPDNNNDINHQNNQLSSNFDQSPVDNNNDNLQSSNGADNSHMYSDIDVVGGGCTGGISVVEEPAQQSNKMSSSLRMTTNSTTSRSERSRFLPLDAPLFQYAGMLDANHPPVFAAIMRRTTGIKVLECHAFICRRDAAANALVRCCTHAYADYLSLSSRHTSGFSSSFDLVSGSVPPPMISPCLTTDETMQNGKARNRRSKQQACELLVNYKNNMGNYTIGPARSRSYQNSSIIDNNNKNTFSHMSSDRTIITENININLLPTVCNSCDGCEGTHIDNASLGGTSSRAADEVDDDNYAIITKQQAQLDNYLTANNREQKRGSSYTAKAGSSKSLFHDFQPQTSMSSNLSNQMKHGKKNRCHNEICCNLATAGMTDSILPQPGLRLSRTMDNLSHSLDLLHLAPSNGVTCCGNSFQETSRQSILDHDGKDDEVKYSLSLKNKRHSKSMQDLKQHGMNGVTTGEAEYYQSIDDRKVDDKGESFYFEPKQISITKSATYQQQTSKKSRSRGRNSNKSSRKVSSCQNVPMLLSCTNDQDQQVPQTTHDITTMNKSKNGSGTNSRGKQHRQQISIAPPPPEPVSIEKQAACCMMMASTDIDESSRSRGRTKDLSSMKGSTVNPGESATTTTLRSRSRSRKATADRSSVDVEHVPTSITSLQHPNDCLVSAHNPTFSSYQVTAHNTNRSSTYSNLEPRHLGPGMYPHLVDPIYAGQVGYRIGQDRQWLTPGVNLVPSFGYAQYNANSPLSPSMFASPGAPINHGLLTSNNHTSSRQSIYDSIAVHHQPSHMHLGANVLQNYSTLLNYPPLLPAEKLISTNKSRILPSKHNKNSKKQNKNQTVNTNSVSATLASKFRCLSPPLNFISNHSESQKSTNHLEVQQSACYDTEHADHDELERVHQKPPDEIQELYSEPIFDTEDGEMTRNEVAKSDETGNTMVDENLTPKENDVQVMEQIVSAKPGFISHNQSNSTTSSSSKTTERRREKKMSWIKRLSLTMTSSSSSTSCNHASNLLSSHDNLENKTILSTTKVQESVGEHSKQTKNKSNSKLFSGSLTLGRKRRQKPVSTS